MVKNISKQFIKGVGSVMDLYPRKKYPIRSYVPGQSIAERLRGDWERVGMTISKATSSHNNGKR